LTLDVPWNTGQTYAGPYAFHVRVLGGEDGSTVLAAESAPFVVQSDLAIAARVVPDRASVTEGASLGFAVSVENRGANTPTAGLVARLRIGLSADPTATVFETEAPVPLLLPGGAWTGRITWPAATPAGTYTASLGIAPGTVASLATATAGVVVTPVPQAVAATVTVDPPDVFAGDAVTARVSVTNRGLGVVSSPAVTVDVVTGAIAAVEQRQMVAIALSPGETRTVDVTLASTTLAAGAHTVRVRTGEEGPTLAQAPLRIHGPVSPPSLDSPADGVRVATPHPTLIVNNGSGAGAVLTYEFVVYLDAALAIPVAEATLVPEGSAKTAWVVPVNLTEDRVFYWRARAHDGFRPSPWMAAASFRVDAINRAPMPPVVDAPLPGTRVASREPALVVKNAIDNDFDVLTYDFRLAADAEMTTLVASVSALSEGVGVTSWIAPVALQEDTRYYWSARAGDGHGFSEWSTPVSFLVDTVNGAPSAPQLLRPALDAQVAARHPELAVANASDPEHEPLRYRFQVDRAPSFDTLDLQTAEVGEEATETTWTPPLALADNTPYFWRCAAFDGTTQGPWVDGRFFTNVVNDAPGTPVAIEPVAGQSVGAAMPVLRIRNAVDLDRDALVYDFVVTTQAGVVVAQVEGIVETPHETTWKVSETLTENARYLWSARARDAETASPWSEPASFRVDAVADPPTAPILVAPVEGAAVTLRRPALTVANATSPDGRTLTYTFELYAETASGTFALRDSASGLPEGLDTTSWTPALDLPDGRYSWRARASDGLQAGPWMASAHFAVRVDAPPGAPTGLTAVAGDGRIMLAWTASPEPDVVRYRVYRSAAAGGPYSLVSETTTPAFAHLGLPNGVTVYYVVAAVDATQEGTRSIEVHATPQASTLTAEVRYTPAQIPGHCLVDDADDDHDGHHDHDGWIRDTRLAAGIPGHHDHDDDDDEGDCPSWVYAAIELPPPAFFWNIDRDSVRLAGDVAPDGSYFTVTDTDGDHVLELRLRFPFQNVRPHLVPGLNRLRISGRAAGTPFQGEGILAVTPLQVELWMTPRTLSRKQSNALIDARLTFADGVRVSDVDVASLRLNGSLRVMKVVSSSGSRITVRFDRAAFVALVPPGNKIDMSVTVAGLVKAVPFSAADVMRVVQ
jgi:hypothetical protein